MPPRKPPASPNPAAGKDTAEIHYRAHRRNVNGKRVWVRSHTRQAQITRTKEAWIGAAFSTATAGAVVLEAGATIVMSLGLLAITAFGWLAFITAPGAAARRKKIAALVKRLRGKPTASRRQAPRKPRAKSTPKPKAKPTAQAKKPPRAKPTQQGQQAPNQPRWTPPHQDPGYDEDGRMRPGVWAHPDGGRIRVVRCSPCYTGIDPNCPTCKGNGLVGWKI